MTTRAAFPENVAAPVQYGARIAAFVVYLLDFQLLPENGFRIGGKTQWLHIASTTLLTFYRI